MLSAIRISTVALTLVALCLAVGIPNSDALAERKEEKKLKKGKVIGIVTKKGRNHIEVKAFGEAKARKYFPHWKGGLPKDGGGFDKKILKIFRALKVGSRVQIEWVFSERLRAEKVKVLGKPKETDKKDQ